MRSRTLGTEEILKILASAKQTGKSKGNKTGRLWLNQIQSSHHKIEILHIEKQDEDVTSLPR